MPKPQFYDEAHAGDRGIPNYFNSLWFLKKCAPNAYGTQASSAFHFHRNATAPGIQSWAFSSVEQRTYALATTAGLEFYMNISSKKFQPAISLHVCWLTLISDLDGLLANRHTSLQVYKPTSLLPVYYLFYCLSVCHCTGDHCSNVYCLLNWWILTVIALQSCSLN